MIGRRLHALASTFRGRHSSSFSKRQPSTWPASPAIADTILASYDEETREWVHRLLVDHDFRPPFPSDDPEAKHDVVRLRGALPALAEILAVTRSHAVAERIEFLLRATLRQIDDDRRVGWDTTNAALRLLSLLNATETLRSSDLSLPDRSGALQGFIVAHAGVLRVGRFCEPEGNHRLINAAGRAAVQLLLDPLTSLRPELGQEVAEAFRRQFLHDGGHAERSPHYHLQTMATTRLITSVDAARCGGVGRLVAPVANRVADALAVSVSPSGTPIRFGDISRSFSGRSASCETAALLDESRVRGMAGELRAFGLVQSRWEGGAGRFALAYDCGAMGLDGNPGHGHADMLSFCFWIDDVEVVCDPGTFMYADRPDAMEFKLAAAHNCIDWPANPEATLSRYFRWRRVPKPPTLHTAGALPHREHHSVYRRWDIGARRYGHHRTWIPLARGLAVRDLVCSSSREAAVAQLNLPPSASVSLLRPNAARVIIDEGETPVTIVVSGAERSWVDTVWYAPRYGVRVAAPALRSTFVSGPRPSEILTVIEVDR